MPPLRSLPAQTLTALPPWLQVQLPDLPYDYSALEPVINAEIMELHHKKHHQVGPGTRGQEPPPSEHMPLSGCQPAHGPSPAGCRHLSLLHPLCCTQLAGPL